MTSPLSDHLRAPHRFPPKAPLAHFSFAVPFLIIEIEILPPYHPALAGAIYCYGFLESRSTTFRSFSLAFSTPFSFSRTSLIDARRATLVRSSSIS
ncbi:hypothetical protein D9M68_543310 [compost metagenome]